MRARIVTTAALLSIAVLGVGPALAEECSLADTILEQCPPPTPPPPEPQPQPAPEPAPQPEPQPEAQPSVSPGRQPAAVTRLLALLNGERTQRGLPVFTLREAVSAQSREHSEAMAAGGTIWHNDGFFTAANKKRLGAVLLGENVARNVDIDDAHRRLMNSPGHKANIVDRRFTVIGLGVYRSGTGSLYVTESFLQPVAGSAPAAAPAGATPEPSRAATPPPPAAAPTTTVLVPEPALVPGLAWFGDADSPQVLGSSAGVASPVGGGSPLTPLALALVLLATAAGTVGARYRRVFAPLVSRFRR